MTSIWHDIPGGRDMLDWFGGTHRFHDAALQDLALTADATASLRITTSITTDKIDKRGFLVSDRHAVVTINLRGVKTVNLTDLDMIPGIIFALDISQADDLYKIEWSESYGVNGHIIAKHIEFLLEPESADPSRQ